MFILHPCFHPASSPVPASPSLTSCVLPPASENFTAEALALHNDPPAHHPAQHARARVHDALRELAEGFAVRLQQVQRAGEAALAGADAGALPEEKEDENENEDGEETEDGADEPVFSILPVPGGVGVEEQPPVVIGRGVQEVREALGRAAAADGGDARAAHVEL